MPGLLRQGKGKSMKKMMAVYDADTRYAERLSDYVNRKERGVFTSQAFTSKEKLAEYAAKHEIDVLLSGERTDSGDISEIPSGQKIYMSEETERQMESGKEIYKFQSGDDIIREVMAVYSEIPGIRPNTAGSVDQSRRIIGVYSPVGRCGKTCLALAIGQILAKEEKVLFVTLDTFTGFTGLLNERWKRDLSDLIYYYKQERFHIVRLNSLVYYLGDMAWIPPIRIPQDYAQLTAQEMADLMERILRERKSYDTCPRHRGLRAGRPAADGKMSGCLRTDQRRSVFCGKKCVNLRSIWKQREITLSQKRSRRSMCRW